MAGAIGYQVYAAPTADGPWEPVDHAGRDVLAVPHPPYADTTGAPGETRWYAVTSLSDVHVEGERCEAVSAASQAGPAAGVTVEVDAADELGTLPRPWRPMIGSEHLSHLLSTDTTGGRVIGEELTSALKAAHDELGVSHVRAHAILGDDLGVYREVDGEPVHDFAGVDRVYDHLRSIGLYPVVELSFMPHDLAVRPGEDGVRVRRDRLAAQGLGPLARPDPRPGRAPGRPLRPRGPGRALVVRGLERGQPRGLLVGHARGVPAALRRDRRPPSVRSTPASVVGGPSSAAAGWVEELLAHVERAGSPVDFVSTHTYGSPPLDFRPMLARYGREGTPIWWTEWGVTPTHFNEVSDAVFAATFLLRGMASCMGPGSTAGRGAVVLGGLRPLRGARPPARPAARRLRHSAPSASCASRAGGRWPSSSGSVPDRLAVTLTGDGAGSLVEASARARRPARWACSPGTSPSTS